MNTKKKVDIRLNDELNTWIESESKKLALNKSAFARMILEQARQAKQSNYTHPINQVLQVAEDPNPKQSKAINKARKELLDQ